MASMVALLSSVTAKLGTIYEQNSLLPAGSWAVPLQGRHYSFEQYILRAIRTCFCSTKCYQSVMKPFRRNAWTGSVALQTREPRW